MQFANTGPFCDIQVRYDPKFYEKYNPNSVENRLDWNPSETFKQYLMAVKEETDGREDPTGNPCVQIILACLGDRVRLEMTDEIQEEHEKQMEQLEKQEDTLKGGESNECDRPVHDAADGQWNGEYAQDSGQREAGGQ